MKISRVELAVFMKRCINVDAVTLMNAFDVSKSTAHRLLKAGYDEGKFDRRKITVKSALTTYEYFIKRVERRQQ